MRALGDIELTALNAPVTRVEADGDGVTAVLAPARGPAWLEAHAQADATAQRAMEDRLLAALRALAAAGVPLGALDPLALRSTDDGPRLLPSAWLVPPSIGAGVAMAPWTPDASRAAVESLIAQIARRGGPTLALDDETDDAALPSAVASALAALDAGQALSVRPSAAWGPVALTRGVGQDAVRRGYQVLELAADHRSEIPERRSDQPALILVAGARNYADVAVALESPAAAAWLDGDERLVWIGVGGLEDAVLDLFLEARFGPARRTIDLDDGAAATAEVLTGPDRFLRDALGVVEGPLPALLLQRLVGLSVHDAVALFVDGWRAGRLQVFDGHHVVGGGRCTSVLAWPPPQVDGERRSELGALVPEILDRVETRRVDAAWWRARLLARSTDDDRAARALRDVARRAEARASNLLALSAYDRIAELGGAVTLDDEIRGAALRAETRQRAGDLEAAQRGLEAALDRVSARPEAADPAAWADLVFRAVQLDFHRSDFAAAESRLQDLLERARATLPTEPRALAYGELAWAQLHRGRTGEAVRTAELALRRLDPLQHGALVARLHNLVGFALYKQSDYSQSLVHYDRALRLREQLEDELGVARTQNNMALSHMALGQIGEAEATLRDSIRRKRAAGDDLSIAASLINLGVVLLEKTDLEGTEDAARQALEIGRLRQHPETEAEAWGLLGDVALDRGDARGALELFQRNLSICEANGHDTERLATLRRLGATLLALDEDDAAAERLEEARRLLEAQPSRYEAARIDALEAEILRRSGSDVLAIESLSRAARGFALVGRHTHQVEALIRRGEIEHALGRETRLRATLAEVRDLLARHEIHRPPHGVDALERHVRDQQGRDEPLTPEACVAYLVDALDHPVERWDAAFGAAAALASSLGADAVVALDVDAKAARAREHGWDAIATPAELAGHIGDVDGFERRGRFDVYTAADGARRIAVEREIPLRAHERELVRGLVRLWSQGLVVTLEGSVAHVAPAPAPGSDAERRHGLIGRSEAMRRVVRWIERVADTDLAVLILGPNGSGKELVARALHRASGRADGPFVAINCASIPASLLESELFGHERGAFTSAHSQRIGRFEQARGGTLFLDEIGEMPADMQAKLLRVLQERTFTRVGGSDQLTSDARIVAATNRDLEAEVERGNFRVDLYFRLNVVTIDVPGLRDRLEDVEALVRFFVARDAAEYRGRPVAIDDEVFEHLRHHDWPGNVRELENVVRNALVFGQGDVLRAEDFPLAASTGRAAQGDAVADAVQAIVDDERWSPDRPILPRLELLITHALVERVGNKTHAARLLGITKPTLYDRLRRYQALFGEPEPRR